MYLKTPETKLQNQFSSNVGVHACVRIGEFPVMTPGKVHEYASCTTFSTTSEYMEGHYTFHRLKNKGEVFDVSIPRFHMVCPPFRESMARSVCSFFNYQLYLILTIRVVIISDEVFERRLL